MDESNCLLAVSIPAQGVAKMLEYPWLLECRAPKQSCKKYVCIIWDELRARWVKNKSFAWVWLAVGIIAVVCCILSSHKKKSVVVFEYGTLALQVILSNITPRIRKTSPPLMRPDHRAHCQSEYEKNSHDNTRKQWIPVPMLLLLMVSSLIFKQDY